MRERDDRSLSRETNKNFAQRQRLKRKTYGEKQQKKKNKQKKTNKQKKNKTAEENKQTEKN